MIIPQNSKHDCGGCLGDFNLLSSSATRLGSYFHQSHCNSLVFAATRISVTYALRAGEFYSFYKIEMIQAHNIDTQAMVIVPNTWDWLTSTTRTLSYILHARTLKKHTIGVGIATYTWMVPHLATDYKTQTTKILKHAQCWTELNITHIINFTFINKHTTLHVSWETIT